MTKQEKTAQSKWHFLRKHALKKHSSLVHTMLQPSSFTDETRSLYNHLYMKNLFPVSASFYVPPLNQMSISKAQGAEGHCRYEAETANYHLAGIFVL